MGSGVTREQRLACGHLDLEDLAQRLSAWYEDGLWAVGALGRIYETVPEYARELEWSCCGNKFEDLQAVYKSSLDRSSKRHYNDNVKAIKMALT